MSLRSEARARACSFTAAQTASTSGRVGASREQGCPHEGLLCGDSWRHLLCLRGIESPLETGVTEALGHDLGDGGVEGALLIVWVPGRCSYHHGF